MKEKLLNYISITSLLPDESSKSEIDKPELFELVKIKAEQITLKESIGQGAFGEVKAYLLNFIFFKFMYCIKIIY